MRIIFQILFIPVILVSVFFALFAYYILKNKNVYVILKGCTTLLIALFCAASYLVHRSGYTLFITPLFIGLVFSVAGDVIIFFKKSLCFIIALLCFTCTHIAYTLCFLFYANFSLIDIGTGIAILLIGLLFYKYFFPRLKKLKIPVAAYVIIISLMIWRALSTLYNSSLSITQGIFIVTGSILFYVSDIVLGFNMFVKPVKKFVLINLTLYYLGQFFIALSCYYFT